LKGKKTIDKFILYTDKKQFCPTPEDLESEELRRLAKKLKGDSEKETFTNILEWQDRNIQYWKERFICSIIFKFVVVYESVLVTILLYLIVLEKLPYTWATAATLTAFLVITILFICSPLEKVAIVLILLLLFCGVAILNELLLWITPLTGAVLVTLSYLIAGYWLNFRGYQVSIRKVFEDTFRFSLSVEKILKYRLAVCKDYAKLTAALLFSIYPDSKVYFITISLHTAVMVELDGRYYVLDKKLPILTRSRWLKANRHLIRLSLRKIAEIYVSELMRDPEGKPVDIDFRKHERISLSDFSEKPVNTEKLTKEVAKLLKIS